MTDTGIRPRKANHFLATTSKVLELPITVGSDGSVMLTIRPNYAINVSDVPHTASAGASSLPFAWMSLGNSTNIYQSTPTTYGFFN